MPVIKLHLEQEEYAPIVRAAERLHVSPEDIVYAGLHRMMLTRADPLAWAEVADLRLGRKDNLPRWADSARSVHAYEGKHDDYSEPAD
jgi:hypothetical protein